MSFKKRISCGIYPSCAEGLNFAVPENGTSPKIARKSDVLPVPFAPRNAMRSFSSTSSSACSNSAVLPNEREKPVSFKTSRPVRSPAKRIGILGFSSCGRFIISIFSRRSSSILARRKNFGLSACAPHSRKRLMAAFIASICFCWFLYCSNSRSIWRSCSSFAAV